MPKHSGFGIASFVLGLAAVVVGLAGFIVFTAAIAAQMPNLADVQSAETSQFIERFAAENTAVLVVFGVCFLLSLLFILIGLVLGISGLFQQNRRKGFAIAGTVINGVSVAFVLLMILVGAISRSAVSP